MQSWCTSPNEADMFSKIYTAILEVHILDVHERVSQPSLLIVKRLVAV